MLASKEARARFVDDLYRYMITADSEVWCSTSERIPGAALPAYLTFVQELAAMLRPYHAKLLVAVPAADPDYDYAQLAAAADALILMTYDEHFERGRARTGGRPGLVRGHARSALQGYRPRQADRQHRLLRLRLG